MQLNAIIITYRRIFTFNANPSFFQRLDRTISDPETQLTDGGGRLGTKLIVCTFRSKLEQPDRAQSSIGYSELIICY